MLVVEQYNSIGGMTITEEITLPCFKSDIHAYGYQLANFSPAPRELELDRYGFELLYPDPSISHLFPDNDGGIISMYRDVNKTVKSIEKYSNKDAQTWEKTFNRYLANRDKIIHSLNTPPPHPRLSSQFSKEVNMKDEQAQDCTLDYEYRSGLQSLRSWCNEYFESEETKVFFGSWPAHVCASPDDAGGGPGPGWWK